MPSINALMNGVNTKQKTVYGLISGVNTKMKTGYGLLSGVNTKLYSGLPNVGETKVMGGHNWMVIHADGSAGQVILMCTDALGTNPFNNSDYSDSWRNSSMRSRLSQLYDSWFTAEEKAKIVQRNNPYMYRDVNNSNYYLHSGELDFMWLLSAGEIFGTLEDGPQLQWFAQYNTAAQRGTLFGHAAVWTRTGSSSNWEYVVTVTTTGTSEDIRSFGLVSYRPCILINP